MLVKSNKPKSVVAEIRVDGEQKSCKFLYFIFGVFVIALFALVVIVGKNVGSLRESAFELGFKAINPESIGSVIKRLPGAYLKSKLDWSTPSVPKMHIDIKFLNFTKLKNKKDASIAKGQITQEEGDFVPAKIRFGGNVIEVKLRIKGDNVDHLIGNKWSFRVETKGKSSLLGMRRFSIQNPYVRGFQGQYLIDETRRINGLIALRRQLVNVSVNGTDIGLMEIEEHFSKELLENNGRKESVIIKFDESDSWKFGGNYDFTNTKIDVFRKGSVDKSAVLQKHVRLATGLLRGFVEGKLRASDIFDVRELGMFLAINSLWGSQHGVRWGNLRFYYNPYIGRLQPVGYDDNFHERQPLSRPITDKFFTAMLADESIQTAYMDSLRVLTAAVLEGDLVDKLKSSERHYAAPLYSEFFLLQPYDFSDLTRRAQWIEEYILRSSSTRTEYSSVRNVHIYLVQKFSDAGIAGGYELQFSSAIPLGLKVIELEHPDPLIERKLREWFYTHLPVRLPPRTSDQSQSYALPVPEDLVKALGGTSFTLAAIDGNHSVKENVDRYYDSIERPIINKKTDLKNLLDRGVVSLGKDSNSVVFNTGTWEIDETIRISDYASVLFSPGTTLVFSKGAGILSTIPIEMHGKDSKITFIGDGASGWMYLLGPQSESSINGLVMRNVNSVNFDQVSLTGALSIYDSKVRIEGLEIDVVKSEDALNIINSHFIINGCSISNTDSDAIDTDFARGSINGCRFKNIGALGGGDAVDFSGSEVTVSNSFFELISDKAISVGERSVASVDNVTIENSSVGVASKDGSSTRVIGSKITGSSHAALMAYVKKSEYVGAVLEVTDTAISESGASISDMKSKLLLNGRQINGVNMDTKELYDTVMKPGLK